jgi:hypothetical protein
MLLRTILFTYSFGFTNIIVSSFSGSWRNCALTLRKEPQLANRGSRLVNNDGTGRSVVDGFISQDSVKIAIETKLDDNFYTDQLSRHLSLFNTTPEQFKLLILLSPQINEGTESVLKKVQASASKVFVNVVYASFELVVDKMRKCLAEHDEEMHALLTDYETFCSEENLLPTDKYMLFVPPCSKSFQENVKFKLYFCPDFWNRRKSKYLGVYKEKHVWSVGIISKIVACTINFDAGRVIVEGDESLSDEEASRIGGATSMLLERNWDIRTGHKFFLCDKMVETKFEKATPGGIRNLRYVDLREHITKEHNEWPGIEEIANQLRQKQWDKH